MIAVFLSRSNKITAIDSIEKGLVNLVLTSPRLLFLCPVPFFSVLLNSQYQIRQRVFYKQLIIQGRNIQRVDDLGRGFFLAQTIIVPVPRPVLLNSLILNRAEGF